MEIDSVLYKLLNPGIIRLDEKLKIVNGQPCFRESHSSLSKDLMASLKHVINEMGEASAKAQGLHRPITTFSKIMNFDHILYILSDEVTHEQRLVVGILKMGLKKLYLEDCAGRLHEIIPLCVLDFYIHESYQRKGCGLKLFKYMLKDQNIEVDQLAIDRPSEKLLKFMKKHYGDIGEPVHQRNNFTVYQKIFSEKTLISVNNEHKYEEFSKRRQSRSDQVYVNAPVHSTMCQSIKRHSFPNCEDLKPSNSSVASVVFGQRHSQAYEDKSHGANEYLKQNTEKHGLSCSESIYPMVDSSMNIFGVPSPPNRYHLS